MKRRRVHGSGAWQKVGGLVLLLSILVGIEPAPAEVPDTLYLPDSPRTTPIWVAANAALNHDQTFRSDLFEEHELRALDRQRAMHRELREKHASDEQASSGGCLTYAIYHADRINPKPNSNLEDLLRHSRYVVYGIVIGAKEGFMDGSPASLLEIDVTEVIGANEEVLPKSVLVFHQYARIQVGVEYFCAGSDKAYEPRLGDEALVFVYDELGGSEGNLVQAEPEEMFFGVSQQLFSPNGLISSDEPAGLKTLKGLTAEVRERLGRQDR